MVGVLHRVFGEARYIGLAILVAFLVLSAAVLSPHVGTIYQVALSDSFSVWNTTHFIGRLYGSLGTNFTLLAAVNTLVISMLLGLNIAMLVYYIRRRQMVVKDRHVQLTGIGGLVSGVLGVGCAACGSVIVTATAGLFGVPGLLLFLPLHGAEFGILAIALLLVSLYYITKRIEDPLICPTAN